MVSVYSCNPRAQKQFSFKAAAHLAGLTLFTSLTLSLAQNSLAQTFPDKPLKIVVGFPPGGGSDQVRLLPRRSSLNQSLTATPFYLGKLQTWALRRQ
jgi:hypothetical protein